MSLSFIRQIEKNIKRRIKEIKEGELTPSESGIGKQFNRLRDLDEASYFNLLQEYKKVLNEGVNHSSY